MLPKAGSLPIKVFVTSGIHGVTVTGKHGIGVNAPIAADVAAATCGLARELHIPNEQMLTIGR